MSTFQGTMVHIKLYQMPLVIGLKGGKEEQRREEGKRK